MKTLSALAIATLLLVLVPAPVSAAVQTFATPVQPTLTVTNITTGKGKPPTCEVKAMRKTLRAGESSTIFWRSKHADHMVGLFSMQKQETSGRTKVRFMHPGEEKFTLIFVGEGGATSCDLKIKVREKKA